MTAAPPETVSTPVAPPPVASDPTPAARRPFVTGVLLCRGGADALAATLSALSAQTRAVDRIVVLDLAHGPTDLAQVAQASTGADTGLPAAQVVSDPADGPLGAAVNRLMLTLAEAPDAAAEWWWLLPDEVIPEPAALAKLVDAVRRSPSVGMAGPKVLDRNRPRLLLEVGHQLTRSGRRIAAPARGEPDQGQFDTRTDVLAVGLSGMLVRRDVLTEVGGFETTFAGSGEALDLGWRAQLAGERVVVVPAARVLAGPVAPPPRASLDASQDPAAGEDPPGREKPATPSPGELDPAVPGETMSERRAARRAARRIALTRCSPWAVPGLALWVLFSSIGSALVLLLLKRPAHAWVELADLGALVRPFSSVGARWRFRSRRRLRRRDLATLFVTPGESLRHTADRVQDALTPDRDGSRGSRADVAGAETGPVAEEAEDLNVLSASLPERVFTNPGVLATLAAAIVAALGFRSSLRGGLLDARGTGLAGGELARVSTDAAGLWHAFRDSWHGAGLGTDADSAPYLGVLSVLTWLVERLPYVGEGRSPASVLLAWTLVLGMPLATAAAYLAGRVVTRARWPRGLAAFAWGTSGVAAAAVSHGRVTLVLAHILLPLVLAGTVRLARADGTFTAAAATALGAAVLGAMVPPYLALVAVAAAVLVVVGPGWGRRVRGLALLVLPPALQGSWLTHLSDPVAWLGAPGALDSAGAGTVSWWELLAGYPDGGSTLVTALSAPVLLAGVSTLVRRPGSRGAAVAYAVLTLVAALGLTWALLARRVVVGAVQGANGAAVEATPWPGVGLQCFVLAVIALALLGSVGMRGVLGKQRWAPRRLLAGAGLVVITATVVGVAGISGWSRLDGIVSVGFDAVPAVAVEQARGPEANRMIVISTTDAAIEYQLVAREPGEILRGLSTPNSATDPGLATAVTALVASQAGDAPGAGAQLADLGVGFVSVQGGADPEVIRTLDSTAGLTRLGNTDDQTLWRVLARPSVTTPTDVVPASRARITTADGSLSGWVRVEGAHGALTAPLPAGPVGRRVVLAEPREWIGHAQVRFDGELLTATAAGLPTYMLPERAGLLSVDIPPRDPGWFAGQLALLALTVFLAVPFGNRRSRRIR
mgnify:CR=1 FL=1